MADPGLTQAQMEQLQEKAAMKQAVTGSSGEQDNDGQLIDTEQVKQDIRKALRGTYTKWVEIEEDGKTVYRKVEVEPDDDEKLCNEKCIQEINRTIEGHVNTNVSGSYFRGKDIEVVGAKACHAIAIKLYENHDRYDIDGPGDASQIMSIVASNLKGAIKKAKGGRLLKHNEQTREIREVRKASEGDEQSSGPRSWFPL